MLSMGYWRRSHQRWSKARVQLGGSAGAGGETRRNITRQMYGTQGDEWRTVVSLTWQALTARRKMTGLDNTLQK